MLASYLVAKIFQGASLLVISVYGNYALDSSTYVLLMSVSSLMAFAHTIDAGLSVNLLHLAAKNSYPRKDFDLAELYSIAHHSYNFLGSAYFILILPIGLFYLSQLGELNISQVLIYIFNSFCTASYVSILGKAAYFEGVDPKKEIIRYRAIATFAAFNVIFMLFIFKTDVVLITPVISFLFFFLTFRYLFRSDEGFRIGELLGFRKTIKLLFGKYFKNQFNIIVAWIAGYLLLHVPLLIGALRFDAEEIQKYILASVLLFNALGFSNIFIQPYINDLAKSLHERNLTQLKQILFSTLKRILICFVILFSLLTVALFITLVNMELFQIFLCSLISWLLVTFVFVLAFVLRSQQGEQMQFVSLFFATVYILFMFSNVPDSSKDLSFGFTFICLLYLLVAVFTFVKKFGSVFYMSSDGVS